MATVEGFSLIVGIALGQVLAKFSVHISQALWLQCYHSRAKRFEISQDAETHDGVRKERISRALRE